MSTTSKFFTRIALVLGVLGTATAMATAGSLTISWSPSVDEMTVGYDVEILDEQGQVVRVIDAEIATTITIEDLEDGVVHRLRVRPYDARGTRARRASSAITTMPAPRVESFSGAVTPGISTTIAVEGANLDARARFLSKRAGLAVASATVIAVNRAELVLAWDGSGASPSPADLLVVNPVRKAEPYFEHHPQVLDVDASGRVESADEQLVKAAFGLRRGDPGYSGALDVNGDGVIGGEDTAPIRAYLEGAGTPGL